MATLQRRRLQRQLASLAVTAPQVMAQRTCRSWQALCSGDASIWGEWWWMGAEKWMAAQEAGWAMTWRAVQMQGEWWQQAWTGALHAGTPQSRLNALQSDWMALANSGLHPLHKRVQGNLRRLRRQTI